MKTIIAIVLRKRILFSVELKFAISNAIGKTSGSTAMVFFIRIQISINIITAIKLIDIYIHVPVPIDNINSHLAELF